MALVSMAPKDLDLLLRRVPQDVLELLKEHPGTLFLAGGAIRSIFLGEHPSDYDLFGPEKKRLANLAQALAKTRKGRVFSSTNAETVIPGEGRMFTAVQFITKWQFASPEEVAKEFDFTGAKAILYYGKGFIHGQFGGAPSAKWEDTWLGMVDDQFYSDLAAKRLVYTGGGTPGGSILRMVKLLRRGFNIQVDSLAKLLGHLENEAWGPRVALPQESVSEGEHYLRTLREVDLLPAVLGRAA